MPSTRPSSDECLAGRVELYKLLDEGMDDIGNNEVLPAEDVFRKIESGLEE